MCEFIAEHRARFPIAAMCRALTARGVKISARTFHAWVKRAPSKRALWDTALTEILARYYEPDENGKRRPECLYGAEKMWAHLRREGIQVARCTVERLMRANRWRGVVRCKKIRTIEADPAAARAADLVDRQFRVPAPNCWSWPISPNGEVGPSSERRKRIGGWSLRFHRSEHGHGSSRAVWFGPGCRWVITACDDGDRARRSLRRR